MRIIAEFQGKPVPDVSWKLYDKNLEKHVLVCIILLIQLSIVIQIHIIAASLVAGRMFEPRLGHTRHSIVKLVCVVLRQADRSRRYPGEEKQSGLIFVQD